jgi:hypothetical protein
MGNDRVQAKRGGSTQRRRLGLGVAVLALGIVGAACLPPAPPPPPPPPPANLSISGGSDTLLVFMPPGVLTNDTYTVTNTGGQTSGALTGSLVNASGDGTFSISAGTCGFAADAHPTLAPNASCTVTVDYTPAFVSQTGAVTLSVTAAPGGTATRALTGESAAPSELAFAAESHAFSDSNLPGSDQTGVLLTNHGIAPTSVDLSITDVTGTGTFSLNPGVCPSGLAAGLNCNFTVFYENNTGGGTGSATLVATGDSSTATMLLTGTGTGTANVLTIDVGAGGINDLFSDTLPSGPLTLTVTNAGAQSTGVLSGFFDGSTGDGLWQFGDNLCLGAVLAPGGQCTMEVYYQAVSLNGGTLTVAASGTPGGYISGVITGTPTT